jgi:hypothetical protein
VDGLLKIAGAGSVGGPLDGDGMPAGHQLDRKPTGCDVVGLTGL